MRATLALAFFCMPILFCALPLVATPVFSDSATGTIPCRNPAQPTQFEVVHRNVNWRNVPRGCAVR